MSGYLDGSSSNGIRRPEEEEGFLAAVSADLSVSTYNDECLKTEREPHAEVDVVDRLPHQPFVTSRWFYHITTYENILR